MTFDICMQVWFWSRHHILKRCRLDWLSQWSGSIAAQMIVIVADHKEESPVLHFADWSSPSLIVIFRPPATKISFFNEGLFWLNLEVFLTGYLNSKFTGYSLNQNEIGRIYSTRQNIQTSQELRMLSSVTLNCQETKTVMNSGSQLSEY